MFLCGAVLVNHTCTHIAYHDMNEIIQKLTNSRLVPSDAGVDDGRTGILDGLGEELHLLPRAAILDQIQHGQTENDDKVPTDGGPGLPNNVHREAHAVGKVRPAVLIGPVVGLPDEELVDEIPLAAHDLDAVVSGPLGQGGAPDKVGNGTLDARRAELLGREGRYRTPGGRRRHGEGVDGVPAGVQDLHADAGWFRHGGCTIIRIRQRSAGNPHRMHRIGHQPMPLHLRLAVHLGGERTDPAGLVGRDAAGDHEADAALGAEAEVFGHARQIVVRNFGFEERHQEGRDGMSLEAGVHRSHEDAVGEGADVRAEGQRFEHAGKVRGRVCGCIGIID